MKRWMHKIELFVNKVIPYMLVLLLGIIIVEIFFEEFAEQYYIFVSIADYTVLAVFVADLIFKWIRIHKIKPFLKKCWLDIIAVFPFFIFFRAYELVAGAFSVGISETAGTVQAVLHEGVELEKEGAKIAEAIEKGGTRLTRTTRFARFIRIFTRLPRFIKAIPFYANPTRKHHSPKKK